MDIGNNAHSMITRSKQKLMEENDSNDKKITFEQVDSNGNLMDLIDDSEASEFDEKLLKKEIERLRGGSPKKVKSPSKKVKKIKKKKGNIIDLILPYILMSALTPDVKRKKTKKGITKKMNIDEILESNIDFKIEEIEKEDEFSDDSSSEELISDEGDSDISLESEEEENEDEDED